MGLWRSERRWLGVLFDAILPSGADERLPLGAADLPMQRFVDELFRTAPGQFLLGLRLAIWLVYWTPLLWKLRSFGGLSRPERVAHLERLSSSRLYAFRELPTMLKMVASFAYGAFPEVQTRVGLPPTEDGLPEWAREAAP